MKGLKLDFSMKRGHEMIIEHHPPFMRSGLDQLELNMLQATTVPQLLPLDWVEQDGQLSFHYSIQQLKMLSHFYQKNSISMQSYYSLLLSLSDALISCQEYMLRPQCCLLSEPYIFIEPQTSGIRLAYLPMVEWAKHEELKEGDLLLVAVRWSSYVDELDFAGFQQILQLLSSQNMPLIELRQLLLSLIEKREATFLTLNHKQSHIIGKENLAAEQEHFRKMMGQEQNYNSDTQYDGLDEKLPKDILEGRKEEEKQSISIEDVQQEVVEDKKQKLSLRVALKLTLMLVIALMAIFTIWMNLYVEETSQKSLLLCSGITLIVLALFGMIAVKQWRAYVLEKEMNELEQDEPSSQLEQSVKFANSETVEQNQFSRHMSPIQKVPDTVYLNAAEATVYVGGAKKTGKVELVRQWNNEEVIIPLETSPFLIGRAETGVHFQDKASGISRLHIECELTDGEITVKDLGSKNGTHINGKLMVAYKTYPLQAGDVVQLSSKEGPQYRLKLA